MMAFRTSSGQTIAAAVSLSEGPAADTRTSVSQHTSLINRSLHFAAIPTSRRVFGDFLEPLPLALIHFTHTVSAHTFIPGRLFSVPIDAPRK